MEFVVAQLEDLRHVAKALLEDLGEDSVLTFEGEMGVGKTTFIQVILAAMGIEDAQGSPTYGLVNSYKSPLFGNVFHFDLYRLEQLEEAYDIGIEEMIYDQGICLIEWPGIIESMLPTHYVAVQLRLNDDFERVITWHKVD